MRKQLSGEASQATYIAALEEGLPEEIAKAVARRVRIALRGAWTAEYVAESILPGHVQRLVEQELHRSRQARHEKAKAGWEEWKARRDQFLEDEIERLQRERTALLLALADATGETLTVLAQLYTEEPVVREAA